MTLPAGYSPVTIPSDKPNAPLAVQRAGLTLIEIEGQWASPSGQAAAAQYLLDNFDPLPDQIATLMAQVQAEQDRRIALGIGGTEFRLTGVASCMSLVCKLFYLGESLTTDEQAIMDFSMAAYDVQNAIVNAAYAIRADVQALTVPADAFAFDVLADERWPS